MSHAVIERLMDSIRTRLPGALDTAIQFELFSVLDEFFRGANNWQEEVTISVVAGQRGYPLRIREKAVVNRLMGVVNGDDIPVKAVMPEPGKLELVNEPSQAGTYTATVALSLTDPTSTDGYPHVPDWVLSKYREEIQDGVLGRMMSQPSKPYTSERHAIYHLRRFRNAIAKARTEARHQNLFGGQRWRFPRFA